MKNIKPIDIPEMPWPTASTEKLHNYEEMAAELNELEREYSQDVKLEVIGKTVEGRDIHLVAIGHGDKRFFVSCREHAAEVASTEAMLDYMPKLAGGEVEDAEEIKERCTLLVVPMLSADMADLYVKTRPLLPNIKEELLDLWHENSNKFPFYKFCITGIYYIISRYGQSSSEYFNMITSHKDPVSGLSKYVSHLNDWVWLDAVSMDGQVNIAGDFWQLKLPETQAFYRAVMKYKPQYCTSLHGYATAMKRLCLQMRGRNDSILPLTHDGKMKYGFWARPTRNAEFYAKDPDCAPKGVLIAERYSDSRYLRFSGLPPAKKQMKGYMYPSMTDWEITESYKIAKIANAAVEENDKVGTIPIFWNSWGAGGVGGAGSSVAHNPEFQCACFGTEAFGGGASGQLGVDWGAKNDETAVNAILRYMADLDLPEGWDEFPVFQGPYDIWSKKEWAERRLKSDPEFFERWYPEEEVFTPQPG